MEDVGKKPRRSQSFAKNMNVSAISIGLKQHLKFSWGIRHFLQIAGVGELLGAVVGVTVGAGLGAVVGGSVGKEVGINVGAGEGGSVGAGVMAS